MSDASQSAEPESGPVGWVDGACYARASERGRDALLRTRRLRRALEQIADGNEAEWRKIAREALIADDQARG